MIGKLLSFAMENSIIPDISPKTIMIITLALLFLILFTWKKEA
ncbi:MAG: hypothetical protein ACUBOA_13720 [Candidatus Loosdrechtia sp.]|nr:MAG: hypothetical protein QY305_06680 [Candidatus Jettenia sp. AMX2]